MSLQAEFEKLADELTAGDPVAIITREISLRVKYHQDVARAVSGHLLQEVAVIVAGYTLDPRLRSVESDDVYSYQLFPSRLTIFGETCDMTSILAILGVTFDGDVLLRDRATLVMIIRRGFAARVCRCHPWYVCSTKTNCAPATDDISMAINALIDMHM